MKTKTKFLSTLLLLFSLYTAQSSVCVNVNTAQFDKGVAGWNGWIDGGAHCRKSSNDAVYANSGEYCVRLKNGAASSIVTSPTFDLSGATSVRLEFSYITTGMESEEGFSVQMSPDNGANYITILTYQEGIDFTNGVRQDIVETITECLTGETLFRFMCNGSNNSDRVYLDDISINKCTSECFAVKSDDWESGLNNWVDGGTDCRRNINDAQFADSGSYCVRLQDDSETSHITSPEFNLANASEVSFSFSFIAIKMGENEGLELQYSNDGGANFETEKSFLHNIDFTNEVRKNINLTLEKAFSAQSVFRLASTGSKNQKRIYIDDVNIVTCASGLSSFNWEDLNLEDEAAINSGTNLTSSCGNYNVNIAWSISSNGGNFVPFSGDDFVSYETNSEIVGEVGDLVMAFNNDAQDYEDQVNLTLTFEPAICNANFTLADIDLATLGWQDAAELYINGVNVKENPEYFSLSGECVDLDDENYFEGFEGLCPASPNDPSANVQFDMLEDLCINTIEIKYFSGDDDIQTANPQGQRINLSDIDFVPEVTENTDVCEFRWEDLELDDESAIATGTNLTSTCGDYNVNIAWSTTTNGGDFAPFSGDDYVSYETNSEIVGEVGDLVMAFNNDAQDPEDFISLTLTFEPAICEANFTVADIDKQILGWHDAAEVYINGVNMKENPEYYTFSGECVDFDDEDYFEGFEGLCSSNPNNTTGNVQFEMLGDLCINTIEIKYFSGIDDIQTTSPQGQRINLSDIEFVPEETMIGDECEFKWEDLELADESAITSGTDLTSTCGGYNVNIAWLTNTNGGSFVPFSGDDFVSYETSSEITGEEGDLIMAFDNDAQDPEDYISLTLTFEPAICKANFALVDIDKLTQGWQDAAEVYINGVNIKETPEFYSFSGECVDFDDEDYFEGFEGLCAANPFDLTANLEFEYPLDICIHTIEIKYFSGDDDIATSNPNGQRINLPDIKFTSVIDCSVEPINSPDEVLSSATSSDEDEDAINRSSDDESLKNKQSLSVYPNPITSGSLLNIEIPNNSGITEVKVLSMDQKVRSKFVASPDNNIYQVNTNNFENGQYIVQFVYANRIETKRFIVIE